MFLTLLHSSSHGIYSPPPSTKTLQAAIAIFPRPPLVGIDRWHFTLHRRTHGSILVFWHEIDHWWLVQRFGAINPKIKNCNCD
ncbi:MAG: hypothetical protein K6T90_07035 [Leptolyngbyaceae cyanobacterium HOT.MB2.61]|nr:hypothetical protein [Leptolyngbyaceae cyanobacterium HOT.MB2.61]